MARFPSQAADVFLKLPSSGGISFLDLRGAFHLGPGSAIEDVNLARKMRGTEREGLSQDE